jgi:glyoxylase-like metal-dependent hydrolase (beta-lactamase superfamily II)
MSQQITTEITRISVPTDTIATTDQTNVYLVDSDEPLLIDPAARHSKVDAAIADCQPAHITATHCHPDHIAGLTAYAFETDATVWSCVGYENRFAQSTGVYPARTFRDGHTVGPATVIETPGHASDHTAFEVDLEDGRTAIITGDLVVEEGSVVVGGPDADMAAYLDSLRRIREREPDVLYPGHGPVIDDPIGAIDRLVSHRAAREQSILDVMANSAEEVDEIVDRAYDKDISEVYELARKTVIAHIRKLDSEGRVRWDPETEQATLIET